MKPSAFTLIELLVVITIIVLLLALLTPALDRAIYQTELTVCSAKLHAAATSGLTYAFEFKRSYPYRPGVHDPNVNYWRPNQLSRPHSNAAGPQYDDRQLLAPYSPINQTFIDPLTSPVDLELTDPESRIFGNYSLWYGWYYRHASGGAGMFKVGNRFTWDQRQYSVLASDRTLLAPAAQIQVSSHPDADGIMVELVNQDMDNADAALGGVIIDNDPAAKWTWARWNTLTPFIGGRGWVDWNFAYDDGSVKRLDRLEWLDERLVGVPEYPNANLWPGEMDHLPR